MAKPRTVKWQWITFQLAIVVRNSLRDGYLRPATTVLLQLLPPPPGNRRLLLFFIYQKTKFKSGRFIEYCFCLHQLQWNASPLPPIRECKCRIRSPRAINAVLATNEDTSSASLSTFSTSTFPLFQPSVPPQPTPASQVLTFTHQLFSLLCPISACVIIILPFYVILGTK